MALKVAEDCLYNPRRREQVRNSGALWLGFGPQIVIAFSVVTNHLPFRWWLTFIGPIVAFWVWFILRLGASQRRNLASFRVDFRGELSNREGRDLTGQHVGIAPRKRAAETYSGDPSWDVGFLEVTDGTITYVGDQCSFSIPLSRVISVSVRGRADIAYGPRLRLCYSKESEETAELDEKWLIIEDREHYTHQEQLIALKVLAATIEARKPLFVAPRRQLTLTAPPF